MCGSIQTLDSREEEVQNSYRPNLQFLAGIDRNIPK